MAISGFFNMLNLLWQDFLGNLQGPVPFQIRCQAFGRGNFHYLLKQLRSVTTWICIPNPTFPRQKPYQMHHYDSMYCTCTVLFMMCKTDWNQLVINRNKTSKDIHHYHQYIHYHCRVTGWICTQWPSSWPWYGECW